MKHFHSDQDVRGKWRKETETQFRRSEEGRYETWTYTGVRNSGKPSSCINRWTKMRDLQSRDTREADYG